MIEETSARRKTIRIVHLISNLDTGGAETMLYKLLRSMDRTQFASSVISMTNEGIFAEKIRSLGISVQTLGMKRGIPSVAGLWKLCQALKSNAPDILQTWLYHADTLGLLAAKIVGVPAVSWNIRSVPNDLFNYSALSKSLVRFQAYLSRFPSVAVINSEAGIRVHQGLGYTPKRWEIIPNGFDLNLFKPNKYSRERFRRELGLNTNTVLIGLIARYSPVKNHRLFLQATQHILNAYSDTRFLLVGPNIDRQNPELIALLQSLQIQGNVFLMGNRADVHEIIPALDILTLPSISEGFPNVIGEAMACGVPCVATNVGDAGKIIGETGRIIDAKTPEKLAEAWRELIALGPDGRQKLGSAARRRIESNFDLTQIVARYENLYHGLVRCVA